MAHTEGGHAGGVAGIQHGAVGQYHAQRFQRLVGVLCRAAAHAAGVVIDDAADHGRVDGGRVGADLAAKRQQRGVGFGTDHARLQADGQTVIQYLQVFPAVAGHNQDGVAHRLAR